MLLYYIRHGDPIYNPDQLTPLGRRQAEAAAKRLAVYGLDRIYASTSTRAIQTAQPTCEILKMEMTTLDFANESHAYREFSVDDGRGGTTWVFSHPQMRTLMTSAEVRAMGADWFRHPGFSGYDFESAVGRVQRGTDEFMKSLGYEHVPGSGSYRILRRNDERVALFAHQGFGMAFLSCLMDIPYPMVSLGFDMGHSGITAIQFREGVDGCAVPCVLMLSSDAHLYREGLPTRYGNEINL